MKKNITVSVEYETFLEFQNKIGKGNVSEFIDGCIKGYTTKKVTKSDNIKEKIEALDKTVIDAQIQKALYLEEIRSEKEQDALKAKEMLENEQYKRWVCAVCKHPNYMTDELRCTKCLLKTRNESKTTIIDIRTGDAI